MKRKIRDANGSATRAVFWLTVRGEWRNGIKCVHYPRYGQKSALGVAGISRSTAPSPRSRLAVLSQPWGDGGDEQCGPRGAGKRVKSGGNGASPPASHRRSPSLGEEEAALGRKSFSANGTLSGRLDGADRVLILRRLAERRRLSFVGNRQQSGQRGDSAAWSALSIIRFLAAIVRYGSERKFVALIQSIRTKCG